MGGNRACMAEEYDHLFKLSLIGDYGVGKKCLRWRFGYDTWPPLFDSRGINLAIKTVVIEGKTIKLQIWDTAGEGRFGRTVSSFYYRGCKGIVMVYDITNEKSFDSIGHWNEQIEEYGNPNDVEKMILGNKCDLQETRAVSTDRGKMLADDLDAKFIETSAKCSINVDQAFLTLATDIVHKMERK